MRAAAAAAPPVVSIVDSSVWARMPTFDVVQQRVRRAVDEGQVIMPTAILLEVCFAAHSPAEWDARTTMFSVFPPTTPTTSTHEIAMSIQGKLWHGGKVRAAGAIDTLVAALAIEHGATVIHYDADYERIASVEPRLSHEWVAPRGSL